MRSRISRRDALGARFNRLSLRRKITTAILVTTSFAMLLSFALFSAYEYHEGMESLRQSTIGYATITAVNVSAAVAFNDPHAANETLDAMNYAPGVLSAVVYDTTGKAFASFSRRQADPPPLPTHPWLGKARRIGNRVVAFYPVREADLPLGTVCVVSSRDEVFRQMEVHAVVVLVVFLIVGGIAHLLARLLLRRIMEPVEDLVRVTRQVAATNDYALRANSFDRHELGEISRSLNGMLGKVQDLNRTLERRVRERTEQLAEANRELEAFSYSVSHDLRAPLRHVQGYAQMLGRALGDGLEPKPRRYLQTISDAAADMGRLIDDLLSFSRMGRQEMRQSTIDLSALVESLREELTFAVDGREIEWIVGDLPPARGDAAMIRVALQNLLSNALKYSRKRETSRVEVACPQDDGRWLTICVCDNGAGFDMQYYDKLFGVFQRLHRDEDFEGTGIGLANVRRVILRHGGRVWAESEPDKGARFFFTLPCAGAMPAAGQ